jgi:ribosomal protein S18 acetylase RimI-like enzyme
MIGLMVQIREASGSVAAGCVGVLAALPEFFTSASHDSLRAGMSAGRTWVADSETELAGFVHVAQRHSMAAEITHAAVLPREQGQGVGRALVTAALSALHDAGVHLVEVKTLDASAGYEPYVATRAFWEGLGFIQIDTIDPLPGWQPGNPSAIYVAALSPTITPC